MAFDPNEWEVVGQASPAPQQRFDPSEWEVVGQQQDPQPQTNESFWGRFKNNTVAAANAAFPFADEGAAALRAGYNYLSTTPYIGAVLPDRQGNYDQELQAIRQGEKDYAKVHPYSFAASTGVGLLTSAPFLPSGIAGRATLAGKAAQASAEGLAYGAFQGYGNAEGGVDNRIAAAEDSAMMGALISPAVVGTLGGAAKLLGAGANRLAKSADNARMDFMGVSPRSLEQSFKKGVVYLDEAGNEVNAGSASEITNKLKQDYQLLKQEGFFKGLPSDAEQAIIRSGQRLDNLSSDISGTVRKADNVLAEQRLQYDPSVVKPQIAELRAGINAAAPREGLAALQEFAAQGLNEAQQGAGSARASLNSLQKELDSVSAQRQNVQQLHEALNGEYARALEEAQALQGAQRASAMKAAHAQFAEPWAATKTAVDELAAREQKLFSAATRQQRSLTKLSGSEIDAQANLAELQAEARQAAEKQQGLQNSLSELQQKYKQAWRGSEPKFDKAREYAKFIGLANPQRGEALSKEVGAVRNSWNNSRRTLADTLNFKRSAGAQPKIFGPTQTALEGDSAQLKRYIYGSYSDALRRGVGQTLGEEGLRDFNKANRLYSAYKNFEDPLLKQASYGKGVAGALRAAGPWGFLKEAAKGAGVAVLNPKLAALLVAGKAFQKSRPLAYANLAEALSTASGIGGNIASMAQPLAPRASSLGLPSKSQDTTETQLPPKPLQLQHTYAPPQVPRISYKPTATTSGDQAARSYQDMVAQIEPALVQVESGGNPLAESPKGAIGTHQVTPIAARDVMRAEGIDDSRFSDAQIKQLLRQDGMSAYFGRKYLALMLSRFGGNAQLAEAAYNGGPSRLERVGRDIGKMPAETRSYVRNLAGVA